MYNVYARIRASAKLFSAIINVYFQIYLVVAKYSKKWYAMSDPVILS